MDDVHRGAHGVVEDPSPPLIAEEVAELPEGTPVTVIWSGGNGPHRYVVAVDQRDGGRYAWDGKTERVKFYNFLRFVGQERFHTRVWRVAD